MKYIIPVSLLLLFMFTFCEEHFERVNDFDTKSDYYIDVSTVGLNDSSVTYATLVGSVNQIGKEVNIVRCGFVWSDSTSNVSLDGNSYLIEFTDPIDDTLTFSSRLSNLTSGNRYNYRAFAVSSTGAVFYGNVKSFNTLNSLDVVKIDSIVDKGFNKVKVYGTINYPENTPINRIGIAMNESGSPGLNSIVIDTVPDIVINNEFQLEINRLEANWTYHFRVFVIDEKEGNYIFSFDQSFTTKSHWKELELPAEYWPAGVVLASNNKAYFHLGNVNDGEPTNFYEFNPSNNTFEQKPTCPEIFINCMSFSYGDMCFFGIGETNDTLSNKLWAYNTSSEGWVEMSSMPGEARLLGTGFQIGSKFYYGLGEYYNCISETYELLNDFYCYDMLTDTWEQLDNFPYPARMAALGFEMKGNGYFIGGECGLECSNEAYQFNPSTDTWNEFSSFPDNEFINWFITNKLVVIGNKGYYKEPDNYFFYEYDIATKTWKNAPEDKNVSQKWLLFSTGEKAYGVGGYYQFFEYSPY